jgi:hypothetical protein
MRFLRWILWYIASDGLAGLAAKQQRQVGALYRGEPVLGPRHNAFILPTVNALPPASLKWRPTTAAGRFMLLCVGLAGFCLAMAAWMASFPPETAQAHAAMLWVFFAAWPALAAAITAAASWVVVGRPW